MNRHCSLSLILPVLSCAIACDDVDSSYDEDFRGGLEQLVDQAKPELEPAQASGCGSMPVSLGDELLQDIPNPQQQLIACGKLPETTLDLLVVYEVSLLDAHSHEEISSWIETKFQQANDVFEGSEISAFHYNLVDIRSVMPQAPSLNPGNSRVEWVLDQWKQNSQHSLSVLRDGYGADAVVLVAEPYIDAYPGGQGQSDICGIATLPQWEGGARVLANSNGIPFIDQAFALVEYGCGESEDGDDLTFSHELGHTFGLRHATAQPDPNALFSFAHGYIDEEPYGFATLMACDYDEDATPIEGICNRISRLSDPDGIHLPYCKAWFCQRPTGCTDCGPEATDNSLAFCNQAVENAGFRELSDDRPPQVISDHDAVMAVSGELIQLQAAAFDDEDGNLSAQIEWVNEQGAVLGNGPILEDLVYTPERSFIGARVTDSAGGQDTAWRALDVSWEADPYEPQDGNTANSTGGVQLAIDSLIVRTFDAHDDMDLIRVPNPPMDEPTIDIRAMRIGERAQPELQVRKCSAGIGCWVIHDSGDGSHFSGPRIGNLSSPYFQVRVRSADGASGLDTDYMVRADTLAPATVTAAIGGWYNPERSGHGIDLQRVDGDNYVAAWFTYRPNTLPTWYTSDVGTMDGNVWRAALLETHRESGEVTKEVVGEIALSFQDASTASLSWSIDGQGSGQEAVQHHLGLTGGANGMWHAPNDSGWGLSMWHEGEVLVLNACLYDTYGDPTWVQALADDVMPSGHGWVFSSVFQVVSGINLCPGCDGDPSTEIEGDLGVASFELAEPNSSFAELSLSVNFGSGIAGGWIENSTSLARLAPQ